MWSEEIDAIWISGGNGYYLRWILKETGTDTFIRELLKKGVVYSGWSAGACIAGPTLKYAKLKFFLHPGETQDFVFFRYLKMWISYRIYFTRILTNNF